MTLKDAIEREARQGKLINRTRRKRGETVCLGRIVFKRCNLVLILANRKTARPRVHTISGGCSQTDRPTGRPTCRFAQLVSFFLSLSPFPLLSFLCTSCQPVHSLFAYKAAHIHAHYGTRAREATADERDNCERDAKLLSSKSFVSERRTGYKRRQQRGTLNICITAGLRHVLQRRKCYEIQKARPK